MNRIEKSVRYLDILKTAVNFARHNRRRVLSSSMKPTPAILQIVRAVYKIVVCEFATTNNHAIMTQLGQDRWLIANAIETESENSIQKPRKFSFRRSDSTNDNRLGEPLRQANKIIEKTLRGCQRITNWIYELEWRKQRKLPLEPIAMRISLGKFEVSQCECMRFPCQHM